MREYPFSYEIKSGKCLEECPHGVTGSSGDVAMLGSAWCRDCEYSGDKERGGHPVKCLYDERKKEGN